MEFDDCLKKGFLRKDNLALGRSKKEIEIAEKFFSSAKKNLKIKEYEMTVLASYNSIFHCCRHFLFNKGYTERNHFCLIIAVQILYKDNIKLQEFLKSINKVRISRHQVQYRGDMANKQEAEYVLELNEKFLNYTKEKK